MNYEQCNYEVDGKQTPWLPSSLIMIRSLGISLQRTLLWKKTTFFMSSSIKETILWVQEMVEGVRRK